MKSDKLDNDNQINVDDKLRIMEVVENELEQQRKDIAFCLIIFVCSISVWVLLVKLWYELGSPIPVKLMTVGGEIIAVLMMFLVFRFTSLKLRKLGITNKNIKPTLIRAGIISFAIVVLMIVVKLMIRSPGQPLFNWTKFNVFYLFTAVLQEFLARGFFLTVINNLIPYKHGDHIAIISSSLLFTSIHLHYGFAFMLGAGILSGLLGICYMKDENIWGVSIIHFIFGITGIMMEFV